MYDQGMGHSLSLYGPTKAGKYMHLVQSPPGHPQYVPRKRVTTENN